jgi:hypothetical protein
MARNSEVSRCGPMIAASVNFMNHRELYVEIAEQREALLGN